MARPKKQYGQHFLADDRYVQRIISALAPRTDEMLVEIGPGEGALTLPLLKACKELTAIELDHELIPRLRQRAEPLGTLRIVQQDVLQVNLGELAAGRTLRVVGNLPYYISSPILFHCLQHAQSIANMHFMLQKEVVDRMAAEPGSRTYGRLSVMLQLACRVTPLFEVPPAAFRPPPKVNSAVVRLVPLPIDQRPQVDPVILDAIVKAAFGQRRKTLGNALKTLLGSELIETCDIDPRARAETLAPRQFVNLAERHAQALSSQGNMA